VLGNVISSCLKVMVLAVIGSTIFSQFTSGFSGNQPTIEDAMSMVLAALALLGLGIFGPGMLTALSPEVRSLAPRRRRWDRPRGRRYRCRWHGWCRHGRRGSRHSTHWRSTKRTSVAAAASIAYRWGGIAGRMTH
jgi:type IV secretion system protein TrbL